MSAAAPREWWRRLLHAGFGAFPLAWYLGAPSREVGWLLAAVAVLALVLEALRWRCAPVRAPIERLAAGALRPGERHGITGATLLVLAAAATWLAFPPAAAAAGILVAALADPAAAAAGVRITNAWGRRTWAGSAAALVVACAVLRLVGAAWPCALAVGALATLLERVAPSRVDNLVLAPATAAALAACR